MTKKDRQQKLIEILTDVIEQKDWDIQLLTWRVEELEKSLKEAEDAAKAETVTVAKVTNDNQTILF